MDTVNTTSGGLRVAGGIAGILYAAAFAWLFFGTGQGPGESATADDLISYYTENQAVTLYLPYFLAAIAAVALVLFLSGLRSVLIQAEGLPGNLTTLAFAAGVLFALALVIASGAFVAVPATINFTENPNVEVTPAIDEVIGGAGFGGLAGAHFLMALSIVTTAVLIFRTRVFGVWLGWLSIIAAVAAVLIIPTFVTFMAVPLWVLIASIALLTRREPAVG